MARRSVAGSMDGGCVATAGRSYTTSVSSLGRDMQNSNSLGRQKKVMQAEYHTQAFHHVRVCSEGRFSSPERTYCGSRGHLSPLERKNAWGGSICHTKIQKA